MLDAALTPDIDFKMMMTVLYLLQARGTEGKKKAQEAIWQ